MKSKTGSFDHINNFPRACVKNMFHMEFTIHCLLCPPHTDKFDTCQLNQGNYFPF